MSSKTHGSPAFAKCAAMRAPIVPAPSTDRLFDSTFHREPLPKLLLGTLSKTATSRQDRLQNQHPAVKQAHAVAQSH